MKLTVDIDPSSGFCAGVIRAISTAEQYLRDHARPLSSDSSARPASATSAGASHASSAGTASAPSAGPASSAPTLYSLGAIVHNDEELSRLNALGLRRIDHLSELSAPSGDSDIRAVVPSGDSDVRAVVPSGGRSGGKIPVLIRAHGEPPKTYREAECAGIPLIDCTCPVVIRLQKNIREAWERLEARQGTLLIFGKKGHAEVLGLLGQTDGKAIVVESVEELERLLNSSVRPLDLETSDPLPPLDLEKTDPLRSLDLDRDVEIFSQTTKSPSDYDRLCQILRERMGKGRLTVHDTICKQVSSRHKSLADFAISHDIIIFASGKSSSNGKVLFDLCRSCNPRSYSLESAKDLDPSWFREGDRVGVCGATSTPKWLLEDIKNEVLTNNY
ncbi:MAG: 4-hydroxy-3-methylbut-2-enyl diphosphate reductase [Bacteroidales bacterium]|nr:4-hydroxy-3-methylbut-2-enyl diphosphate reductase [Bacteroidales bacterium]